MEDRELTAVIGEGFEKLQQRIDGREARLTRMEMTQESHNARLERLEKDETAALKVRVENQEKQISEQWKKIESNDTWIRGLLVMVIFALLGVVVQFVMKAK